MVRNKDGSLSFTEGELRLLSDESQRSLYFEPTGWFVVPVRDFSKEVEGATSCGTLACGEGQVKFTSSHRR